MSKRRLERQLMPRALNRMVVLALVALAVVCGASLLSACGSEIEDFASCTEVETGYRITNRAKVSCEEARGLLLVLASAEHGVQTIGGNRGTWECRAFPKS